MSVQKRVTTAMPAFLRVTTPTAHSNAIVCLGMRTSTLSFAQVFQKNFIFFLIHNVSKIFYNQ